jgi:predicted homoserine dehydrogenase-like protein
MIIVDNGLRERAAAGNPIRVGMAGTGFMGRGIAGQITRDMPGMRLAAVFARNCGQALQTCRMAGMTDARIVDDGAAMEQAVAGGHCAITADFSLLCHSQQLDVLIDATGSVEFGARFACEAIAGRKDLVLMNAELDGTVGPILYKRAKEAGLILTGCDGDQPGVQINLLRFVRSIGMEPLVCGNIKGMQDRYRNPTTQQGYAMQWGQSPNMVTSFADGTKISFEQAIVANATGMSVARRGMIGYEYKGHVDNLVNCFSVDELKACGGIVDYVVGAEPGPGVFVFAAAGDERQNIYLDYGKLGKGPLYSFYVPYHLTVFEAPLSAARVVLFRDKVISPDYGPMVDVVAAAKRDLKAGEVIDGLGGYMTYGLCENADVSHLGGMLPVGLAEGCRVRHDIERDGLLTYEDVEIPSGRLVDELRAAQDFHFFGNTHHPPVPNHDTNKHTLCT